MRLLSTNDLSLHEFHALPPYAILSHVWGDDEVLYTDIQNGTAKDRRAYQKLAQAQTVAKQANLEWIWCDTCCIDKSSSAELSEAINSMFSFYADAAVCFAYLEDKEYKSLSDIKDSKWFTRGWTLQELLAPQDLIFFDCRWTRIGSKKFDVIRNMISERTSIDMDILSGATNLQSASVAKRMSWAADRHVTRPEDMAYCLMGLFAVNMPMLYGEGKENAFHRLQEQIMKDSNDHTIFAWRIDEDVKASRHHGLLADSPMAFRDSWNFIPYHEWEDDQPFVSSNRGLRIDLHLTPADAQGKTYYAALNCPMPHSQQGYHGFLAIVLQRLPSGVHQFTRVKCHEIAALPERAHKASVVYVRQKANIEDSEAVLPWHFFMPRALDTPEDRYTLMSVAHYPLQGSDQKHSPRPLLQGNNSWFAAAQASAFHITKRAHRLSAVMYFQRERDGARLAILLGSITDLDVGFDIVDGEIEASIAEIERTTYLQPPGTEVERGTHRVRIDSMIKIDTPRKLYVLDLRITGTGARPPAYRARDVAVTPQELFVDASNDIVNDVREVVAGPDAERYRPRSILNRVRRRGAPD